MREDKREVIFLVNQTYETLMVKQIFFKDRKSGARGQNFRVFLPCARHGRCFHLCLIFFDAPSAFWASFPALDGRWACWFLEPDVGNHVPKWFH